MQAIQNKPNQLRRILALGMIYGAMARGCVYLLSIALEGRVQSLNLADELTRREELILARPDLLHNLTDLAVWVSAAHRRDIGIPGG